MHVLLGSSARLSVLANLVETYPAQSQVQASHAGPGDASKGSRLFRLRTKWLRMCSVLRSVLVTSTRAIVGLMQHATCKLRSRCIPAMLPGRDRHP